MQGSPGRHRPSTTPSGWLLQRVEHPSHDSLEEPLSMMNQETYVKVHDLRKQGWTLAEIAEETGFHPETISIHLKADGPPAQRQVPDGALVMNAFWKQRIATLIQ